MSENLRKRLFQLTVFANFIMVFIYQYLTPNMSDDIIYSDRVAQAGSFFDLFAQEYEHYIAHTGRSIAHIILRIFLYTDNKILFSDNTELDIDSFLRKTEISKTFDNYYLSASPFSEKSTARI